ncbi:hypothetical protein [Arthrobacter sp. DR-2P]|nr:hypothetical protein [Arthrobacter sp. DR-2P]
MMLSQLILPYWTEAWAAGFCAYWGSKNTASDGSDT